LNQLNTSHLLVRIVDKSVVVSGCDEMIDGIDSISHVVHVFIFDSAQL